MAHQKHWRTYVRQGLKNVMLLRQKFWRSSHAVATSREGHRSPRSGPGRPAAKAWGDENRPQLPLSGPRLAKLLQVLIGFLRPQRVERLRRLLGRDVSEGASSAGLAWSDRVLGARWPLRSTRVPA